MRKDDLEAAKQFAQKAVDLIHPVMRNTPGGDIQTDADRLLELIEERIQERTRKAAEDAIPCEEGEVIFLRDERKTLGDTTIVNFYYKASSLRSAKAFLKTKRMTKPPPNTFKTIVVHTPRGNVYRDFYGITSESGLWFTNTVTFIKKLVLGTL